MKLSSAILIFHILSIGSTILTDKDGGITQPFTSSESLQTPSKLERVKEWFLNIPKKYVKVAKNLAKRKNFRTIDKFFINILGDEKFETFIFSLQIFTAIALAFFVADKEKNQFTILPMINSMFCVALFLNSFIFFSFFILKNVDINELNGQLDGLHISAAVIFSLMYTWFYLDYIQNYIEFKVKNILKAVVRSFCFLVIFLFHS